MENNIFFELDLIPIDFFSKETNDCLLSNKILRPFDLKNYKIMGVGFFEAEEKFISCFPKIFKSNSVSSSKEAPFLRELLSMAKKRQQFAFDINENAFIFQSNRFVLAEDLIQDYYERSIYMFTSSGFEQGISNGIHWPFTISNTLPIVSRCNPIYLSFFTLENKFDHNLISEIHKYVLKDITSRYEFLFDELDFISIDNLYIESLIENQIAVPLLRRELSHSFKDSDIRLIKMLIAYLECDLQSPEYLITNAFHSIWELVCNSILHNHSYNFAYPLHSLGSTSQQSRGSMIPDIVLKLNDNKVAIFDAKYYSIKTDSENSILDSLPRTSDFTKQFLYAYNLQFQKFEVCLNCLIMPTLQEIALIGRTTFLDLVPPIFSIQVNYHAWVKAFLSNNKNEVKTELFEFLNTYAV